MTSTFAFKKHTNLGKSLVAVAPSPATTGLTLTVTSGEGALFPASGEFVIALTPPGQSATPTNTEFALVTSRSGDVFNLRRAYEGPAPAQSVAVGWQVANVISAGVLAAIESAITSIGASPTLLGVAPGGNPALSDFQAFNALIAPKTVDIGAFPQAFPSSEPILYSTQITTCQTLEIAPYTYGEPAGLLSDCLDGRYDANIDSSAALAVSYGLSIYLQLADEFNGNWTTYGYSAETASNFILGWQYIVNRLRRGGATNIKFVWCPNVWHNSNTTDPRPYYPGDAYVDYIGVDAFVPSTASPRIDPYTLILPYYKMLAAFTAKPFILGSMGVAEFTGEYGTNNQVVNGSFEVFDSANAPHGWTVTGTAAAVTQGTSMGSASVQEGYSCLVMNHSTGTATVSQTVPVVPGVAYRMGWWTHAAGTGLNEPYSVQVVGGASNGQYLQSSGGSWAVSNPGLTFTGPTSGVTQTIVSFTPPAGATGVIISFGNSAGTVWMDDVRLYTAYTTSYKQWWYQQLFAMIQSSMPTLALMNMWNQSGADGDYRIDSGGANPLAKAAFAAGVSALTIARLNPSATAIGDLSGPYVAPQVAAIHETSGPTQLIIGSIADGTYLKRSGATLIGATPTLPALVRTTTVAYSATITPNCGTTDVLNIGALTGNITIANPTGTPVDGQNLRIRMSQDATGNRTVSFGTNFAFGTDITTAMIPTVASAKWELLFTWNATDSKWRAVALVRGF